MDTPAAVGLICDFINEVFLAGQGQLRADVGIHALDVIDGLFGHFSQPFVVLAGDGFCVVDRARHLHHHRWPSGAAACAGYGECDAQGQMLDPDRGLAIASISQC